VHLRGYGFHFETAAELFVEKRAGAPLPAGIQISHHHVKHLPGTSRITLGNTRFRLALAISIVDISIRSSDCGQPRAPAANKPRPFRDGEARLERPIGNLPRP
jgi:hypothetical protein